MSGPPCILPKKKTPIGPCRLKTKRKEKNPKRALSWWGAGKSPERASGKTVRERRSEKGFHCYFLDSAVSAAASPGWNWLCNRSIGFRKAPNRRSPLQTRKNGSLSETKTTDRTPSMETRLPHAANESPGSGRKPPHRMRVSPRGLSALGNGPMLA